MVSNAKKQIWDRLQNLTVLLLMLTAVVLVSYSALSLHKTVTYSLFYEDMVQETAREIVKKESLQSGVK
jgi:hypothetical protein